MGAAQEAHTLQPEDTTSKIPSIIVFLTYRMLPICSLAFLLYKTHTQIEIDGHQLVKLLGIFAIAEGLVLCGILYGGKYDCIQLEESWSRQD
jgi:hypothetical protein